MINHSAIKRKENDLIRMHPKSWGKLKRKVNYSTWIYADSFGFSADLNNQVVAYTGIPSTKNRAFARFFVELH